MVCTYAVNVSSAPLEATISIISSPFFSFFFFFSLSASFLFFFFFFLLFTFFFSFLFTFSHSYRHRIAGIWIITDYRIVFFFYYPLVNDSCCGSFLVGWLAGWTTSGRCRWLFIRSKEKSMQRLRLRLDPEIKINVFRISTLS